VTRIGAGLGLTLAVTLVAVATAPVARSTALLSETDPTTASLAVGTLDPPSGLTGSAAAMTVTLNWTASPDGPISTGYRVLRATASGGPYSQVGTATPGTAVTTTNAVPATGTYYYVLRTYAFSQPWVSVPSNQATVAVGPFDSGWKACAAQAAVPNPGNGDGNGYQTAPAEACDDDSVFAVDTNSGTNNSALCNNAGKDRHSFRDFTFGLPVTVTSINGIEVRADLREDANGGNPSVCFRLSWDGGTNWTAYKGPTALTAIETTYFFGSQTDPWGRTWSVGEFANTTFRVQIVDVSTNNNRDFSLDGLQARVTYTP
jgi:hypothetical protein